MKHPEWPGAAIKNAFVSHHNNILVGQSGTTLTRLAPMGKVRVGEVTAEAKTIDGYINPRQSVEVIGFENTVVIVRAVHHKQQESINQI